jgi:carbon-monoxide dehydrogenase large subunit
VIDALAHLGVRNIDMPLLPDRVWAVLQGAYGAGGAEGMEEAAHGG